MKSGAEVCVTAALVDGLVMARAPFHSSMNYRSVVAYGVPRVVADPSEKMLAFEAVTEHVARGRWADSRLPTPKEVKATLIVALPLDEVSAKVRTGGPIDDAEDYDLPIWAGVVPMRTVFDDPIDDEELRVEVEAPDYLVGYRRPSAEGG
jgi:nitroimidazol reductase NimA-like FMN-containing flavoprotein (pyridoxamine 5'-phosphate oxidase superfamily)